VQEADGPPAIYRAQVFDEQGGMWYEGLLEAPKGDARPIDTTDRGTFAVWNGEALVLMDGRSLRRVDG